MIHAPYRDGDAPVRGNFWRRQEEEDVVNQIERSELTEDEEQSSNNV